MSRACDRPTRRPHRRRRPGRAASWPRGSPRGGVRTLVCEEHARVGDPGALHRRARLPTASANSICRATSTLNPLTRCASSRRAASPVDYTTPTPLATVIDRPVVRSRARAIARCAAGAEIRLGARVSALDVDASGVRAAVAGDAACGRAWRCSRAAPATNSSAGSASACRRRTCTRRSASCRPRSSRTSSCISAQDVAPGGFAWAVPVHAPRRASTCASASWRRAMRSAATNGCSTRVGDRWGVVGRRGAAAREDSAARRRSAAPTAIGCSAIGDAAGLVKPTTGGGIHYSIVSAALAADVADRGAAARSARRGGAVRLRDGAGAQSSPTSSRRSTRCGRSRRR